MPEKSPVRPTTPAKKAPTGFDGRVAIRHLTAADPVLGRHIARLGKYAFALRQTQETFDALAEAIVYQQLSGKAAATIFGRVVALFPDGRLDATAIHAATDDALRAAGLSRAKVASLRDLAARADAGDIPDLAMLATMDDAAIIDTLTQVRGIGRWTVEMLLMFRLGRPDVLPLGDFGIRKGFAKAFRGRRDGDLASPAEVLKRGERWRPYRSVASWYLWRILEEKPT